METQKQDQFAVRVKKRLLDHGWTVNQLAFRIGRSRTATSIAINHPTMYAGTRALVCRELKIS